MGSLEAYVAALWFGLLGPGDVALQLAPLTFGVGFGLASYLFARHLGGPRVALLALALLAVAPPADALWHVTPRGGYPEMLFFGTLVLLLAAKIGAEEPAAPARRWAGLGLSAGIGFWCHLLIGVYLVAAALYLLLVRPRCARERGPWIALGCFVLGGAPLWGHGLLNNFATFHLLSDLWPITLGENLRVSLTRNLPELLGVQGADGRLLVVWPLVPVIVASWLAALAQVASEVPRRLRRDGQAPALLLVLVVLVTVLAVLLTAYGRLHAQRYWLPAFGALPIIFALWVTRSVPRPVGLGLVGLLIAAPLSAYLTFQPTVRFDHRPLAAAIQQAGIRYAYADYLTAAWLTYHTGEALRVADLEGEWYPLDEQPFDHPAVIVPARLSWLPEALQLAGIRVVEKTVDPWVVYQTTAIVGEPRQPIPRHAWHAEAWPNETDAEKALDGDRRTRWSSGRGQRAGMWFLVDLGREAPVNGVLLDLGAHTADFPRTLAVDVSTDRRTWQTVARTETYFRPGVRVDPRGFRFVPGFFQAGHPSVHDPGNSPDVRFTPVPARFVRVSLPRPPRGEIQTGFDWSIAEFTVFSPAG
jgi:hypothetical protein